GEQLTQPGIKSLRRLAGDRVVDGDRAALFCDLTGRVKAGDPVESRTVEGSLGGGDVLLERCADRCVRFDDGHWLCAPVQRDSTDDDESLSPRPIPLGDRGSTGYCSVGQGVWRFAMTVTEQVTERQARQVAEQAREAQWTRPSFGKELFLGRLRLDLVHPHPSGSAESAERGEAFLAKLRQFCETKIDATVIERDSQIPDEVIR